MRPHPRYAQTDPSRPSSWGTCERCGFIWQLRALSWQFEWAGLRLRNTKHLVCENCTDVPQRQLGAIILPPDPPAVLNARPEQYAIEEEVFREAIGGQQRYLMDGTPRVESNLQSGQAFGQALATDPSGVLAIVTESGQQIILDP